MEYEYENNLDYNDVDMQTDDLPSYPQYGENDYLNDIDPLFKSENVSIKEENSSITGGLISESFSPLSFPQKHIPNRYPQLFHFRLKS